MRPSIAKLAGICFAASLLVLGATALTSHSTTSPAAPMPPAAASARPVPQPQTAWPDGPGKQQFLQICGMCHGPENVLGQNMDAAGWTDVINQMISNGAQGSDADFSAILNYLVTNFGPTPAHVAINKATAGNLQAWLNFPADQAQAIVDYRTKNGDFKSLDDVKKVPGVDPKLLDSVASKLTYEPSDSSASGSSSTGGSASGGTGTTNSAPPAQQPPTQ